MPHTPSGNLTEVLVLGSAHLNAETPNSALTRTLSRLATWKPDAIAIEVLAGELIQSYRLSGDTYTGLRVGGYATALKLEAEARQHRAWSRAEAEALALSPDTPPAERVLAWRVALEPANALLSWTPELELPPEVSAALAELGERQDEVNRLALPLGRMLGHTRVHHIDDHTDVRIDEQMQTIQQYWKDTAVLEQIQRYPAMQQGPELLRQANTADDYWEFLRYSNSKTWVEDSYDLEVGSYLRSPLPKGAHRSRVAQWDTRNLFMTARLRMATAPFPGGRVLALVGAAHKGPLEAALLSLAPDLRVVELTELEDRWQDRQ